MEPDARATPRGGCPAGGRLRGAVGSPPDDGLRQFTVRRAVSSRGRSW
jgi:hypothetical protein